MEKLNSIIGKLGSPDWPMSPKKFPFFYGWVILFCTIIGIIASIPGQTIGISVFTDIYIDILNLSRLQLTSAYMVGTGLSGFMVGLGGRYFDLLGARKFFSYSIVFFGLSLIYMSQVDRLANWISAWFGYNTAVALVLIAIGFLFVRFLGQGMVTLAARTVLSKWWNQKRGRLLSISGVFISFGFSAAPKFLDWEIQQWGWRNAFLINAVLLIFVVSAIVWFLVRDNPEECGLEMDGGYNPEYGNSNPDLIIHRELNLEEAKRTYVYWLATLALGFQGLYATAYTFHVLDIARQFSTGKDTILNVFIYSAGFSVVVNLLAGNLADRMRLRYFFVIFGFSGSVYASSILFLPSGVGLYLLTLGMGISWGLFPVLMNITFARYFGRKYLGSISGSSLAYMVWGSALGPVMFSLSDKYLGGYSPAVILSAMIFFSFGVLGFWAVNPQKKMKS